MVGSQARILYADAEGRAKIASAFNQAIENGRISAPIVLGRDHHDVSGTDSPYRETSNIHDGSQFTADMSIHNVIGDRYTCGWIRGDAIAGVAGESVATFKRNCDRCRAVHRRDGRHDGDMGAADCHLPIGHGHRQR